MAKSTQVRFASSSTGQRTTPLPLLLLQDAYNELPAGDDMIVLPVPFVKGGARNGETLNAYYVKLWAESAGIRLVRFGADEEGGSTLVKMATAKPSAPKK